MIHLLVASLMSLSAIAQDGVRNGADGGGLKAALSDPTDPKNLAMLHQLSISCCDNGKVLSIACPDFDAEDLKIICGQ